MPNALILKLQKFVSLDASDQQAIEILSMKGRRRLGPHRDILDEGDNPDTVKILLAGWACRYKTLADGRRQIIALVLPGDCCDLNVFLMRAMDHSIGTLTDVVYARVDWQAVEDACAHNPRVREALVWETLVNSAIQREWAVSLGRRTALERISHLFCELYYRLRQVDLVEGLSYKMPLTQNDLADAMGISTVHVNRTVKELRARSLIDWKSGKIAISDLDELSELAMFNVNYLQVDSNQSGLKK